MNKKYCTPYKTITFNEDAYNEGMIYHECRSYECSNINENQVEVKLGLGMLYFEQDDFKRYFRILGTR